MFACALLVLAGLGALAESTAFASPAAPNFEGEAQDGSANGAMLLRWDEALAVNNREYELEEASDPQFADARVRYRGSFPSWFMSGRLDQTLYFRVRSRDWPQTGPKTEAGAQPTAWSEWSATKVVIVEHHELGVALLLFGFGAAVFIGTCLTLFVGSRRTSRAR